MVVKIELFTSPSCPHCPGAIKIVEQIENELKHNVQVNKINIMVDRDKAIRYGIMAVPAIAINGIVKFVGAPTKNELLQSIKEEMVDTQIIDEVKPLHEDEFSKCSNCGYGNSKTANFCSKCGNTLESSNNSLCLSCGFENPDIAIYCQECGNNLKEIETNNLELSELIDVNNDSEDKIASLPSIGTILAKKTIQIRNSQGGFESKEDFYNSLNLKPHVVEKIENLIVCGSITKPNKSNNHGRIVDF